MARAAERRDAADRRRGASSWRLYDAEHDRARRRHHLPGDGDRTTAGCYLLLFGPAGSSATVTVVPAAAAQSAAGTERMAAPYPQYVARLR